MTSFLIDDGSVSTSDILTNKVPGASFSTTWNSTDNRRMLADLTSPLSAAALRRKTGRTMYPFTFVLLSPTPWNVGLSGEGKMGNSAGINLSAINDGH